MAVIFRYCIYTILLTGITQSIISCGSSMSGSDRFSDAKPKNKQNRDLYRKIKEGRSIQVDEESVSKKPGPEKENTAETPENSGPESRKAFSQKFNVKNEKTMTASFAIESETITETLTMKGNPLYSQERFFQKKRQVFAKTMFQGSKAEHNTQVFNQSERGILDIVLVVDNSGSMEKEQANLAERLLPLVSEVADSDWRIGLVSTTEREGCLTQVFYHDEPNVEQRFKESVMNLGIRGDSTERGLSQGLAAMSCQNGSWIRPNSNLAVLFVSDEDDCSNGRCGFRRPSGAQYFLDALRAPPLKRELGKTAKIYGIVYVPLSDCPTGLNQAHVYQDAVAKSDGVIGSICDESYTPILERISLDLLNSLVSQFQLAPIPRGSNIEVRINGNTIKTGYVIKDNILTFNKIPPQNAKIEVIYQTQADTTKNDFQVDKGIDVDTLGIFINGNKLDPSSFSYSEISGQVAFTERPADNARLDFSYKKIVKLTQAFALKSEIRDQDFITHVSGVKVTNVHYDKASMTLIFPTPPMEGSEIVIDYRSGFEKTLKYPVRIGVSDSSLLAVTDLSTKANVTFSYSNNSIEFPETEYMTGRQLLMTYEHLADMKVFQLAHTPLANTLVIKGLPKCSQDPGHELQGKSLTIHCLAVGTIEIQYEYQSEAAERFQFTAAQITSESITEVYVNDHIQPDFDLKNQTFILKNLNAGDIVTIIVRNID